MKSFSNFPFEKRAFSGTCAIAMQRGWTCCWKWLLRKGLWVNSTHASQGKRFFLFRYEWMNKYLTRFEILGVLIYSINNLILIVKITGRSTSFIVCLVWWWAWEWVWSHHLKSWKPKVERAKSESTEDGKQRFLCIAQTENFLLKLD